MLPSHIIAATTIYNVYLHFYWLANNVTKSCSSHWSLYRKSWPLDFNSLSVHYYWWRSHLSIVFVLLIADQSGHQDIDLIILVVWHDSFLHLLCVCCRWLWLMTWWSSSWLTIQLKWNHTYEQLLASELFEMVRRKEFLNEQKLWRVSSS